MTMIRRAPRRSPATSKSERVRAAFRLMEKFHAETDCGRHGRHWSECEALVDAFGFTPPRPTSRVRAWWNQGEEREEVHRLSERPAITRSE